MKLNDQELIAQIEAEEAVCIPLTGQLADERAEAMDRYRGVNLDPAPEGRSQVVDKSIADTVEWIVPSLCRIYLGGDEIGRFEPRNPQDEQSSEVETQAVNYYIQERNDFFSHVNSTFRDSLLCKNGYIVAYWNRREDVLIEPYYGLSDEELTILSQDPEVSIIEHTERPDPNFPVAPILDMGQMPTPMLHDVRVERKTAEEYPAIESVPPDEILVSRAHRWTSLLDCDFVQWRRRMTIGQARMEGFDVPDDTPGDNPIDQEWIARQRFEERSGEDDSGSSDITRRRITLKDCYFRIDLRDKGTPQLWRIVYVSGSDSLLMLEEADIIPFAAFSPIVFPHSHIGTSIWDLLQDIALVSQTLTRNMLDNIYLVNNGQKLVDPERTNVEDLLVSRPGGIVRTIGDPGSAVVPLVTPDATASILQSIEYMRTVQEGRTGVTRYSAGLDANTLNKTATGVQQIQASANQRIELIARTMASGFRDLFLIVHALLCKHSTKASQIKLNGKWVPIDPRSWVKRNSFTISVGLGTGTPEQQLAKLQMMAPAQQQFTQVGLAGPLEAYNFGKEMYKAAGYKNADKFLRPPQPTGQNPDGSPQFQMPPTPKDPLVQVQEIKSQSDIQKAQMDSQAKAQELQFNHQSGIQKFQAEQAIQQSNDQRQAQLDQQRFAFDQAEADRKHALEIAKMDREYAFKRWQVEFETAAKAQMQHVGAQQANGGDHLQAMHGMMQQMMQYLTAPREYVRDPKTGKVVGIKIGDKVQNVRRDESGRIAGLH
jgi:hypothetical protein